MLLKMAYWEKVSIDELIVFAQDWRTLKETQEHFDLTATEAWTLFRRIIKKYTSYFEYRDSMKLKAGIPYVYRAIVKPED